MKPLRIALLQLATVIAIAAFGWGAYAQDNASAEDSRSSQDNASAEDSRSSNEAGIAAFQAGDFEAAAKHFAAAAASSDDPLLRKNEALAWFKAKQCEPALEAANAFLLRWPKDDANRQEAAAVVANCKIEFARNAIDADSFDLAEKLLFEADEFATDAYTRDRISTVRLRLSEARNERRDEVAPPPEPQPLLSRPGFWLATTGGALIAAGVVYHLVALGSLVPSLEEAAAGGDRDEYDRLANAVDTARWLVPVLYGVGATSAGIGFWFLLDDDDQPTASRSQRWTAGFSYSASF